MVPGGVAAETRQALTNIKAALEAAGTSLDNVSSANAGPAYLGYCLNVPVFCVCVLTQVVKSTVLLLDIADYAAVNEVGWMVPLVCVPVCHHWDACHCPGVCRVLQQEAVPSSCGVCCAPSSSEGYVCYARACAQRIGAPHDADVGCAPSQGGDRDHCVVPMMCAAATRITQPTVIVALPHNTMP